jgi:ABC-type nitrate/sulfonate/bicarbonate transport system substrate-binding protein
MWVSSRYRVLGAAIVATLVTFACGQPSPTNNQSTKLSQTTLTVHEVQGFGCSATVWLAAQKGLYKKYGLDVTLHPINTSSADVMAGLLGGTVDVISCTGAFPYFNAISQGASIKAMVVTGYGTDNQLLIRKSKAQGLGISSDLSADAYIQKLKGSGLKFAFASVTSDPYVALLAILSQHGLIVGRDVQIQTVGSQANVVAAFQSGQVDGYGGTSPIIFRVKDDQVVRFMYSKFPEEEQTIYSSLIAKSDLIKQHPDTMRAFAKAIVETWDYIVTQPDKAFQELLPMYAEGGITDPTIARSSFDSTVGTLKSAPGTPAVTKSGFDRSLALVNLERKSMSPPLGSLTIKQSDVVDTSFANDAITALGLKVPKG